MKRARETGKGWVLHRFRKRKKSGKEAIDLSISDRVVMDSWPEGEFII